MMQYLENTAGATSMVINRHANKEIPCVVFELSVPLVVVHQMDNSFLSPVLVPGQICGGRAAVSLKLLRSVGVVVSAIDLDCFVKCCAHERIEPIYCIVKKILTAGVYVLVVRSDRVRAVVKHSDGD